MSDPWPYDPIDVMPSELAHAVEDSDYWFVIGGQAVRCLVPYRPSRDVDFGVATAADLATLLAALQASGTVEVDERRAEHTVHLRWNGIKVSLFVLEKLVPHTESRRLTPAGILATKLHAILDRGTRRDFFDLYVTMQTLQLGIAECLHAIRSVFDQPIRDGLLLRALTYFSDAEQEARLPGEADNDWATVKAFFLSRVGNLITPPSTVLQIQRCIVDVARSDE